MSNYTNVSSPLRLSLVGGGTDIPNVFNKIGEGMTISAAINLPVAVSSTKLPLYEGIKLKYSSNEDVKKVNEIIHPIYKSALNYFKFNPSIHCGIELISTACIPSGTGLGSSAAFTSSLVQCLNYHLYKKEMSSSDLLEITTLIEKESGNTEIGYQDQITSIYGSIIASKYKGEIIKTFTPSNEWKEGLTNMIEKKGRLFLAQSREYLSGSYISKENLENKYGNYKKILELTKKLNINEKKFNEKEVAEILCESAKLAKEIKVRPPSIKKLEEDLMSIGCVFVKQLGAGGGGFIFALFQDEDPAIPDDLKSKMITPKISEKGTFINTK